MSKIHWKKLRYTQGGECWLGFPSKECVLGESNGSVQWNWRANNSGAAFAANRGMGRIWGTRTKVVNGQSIAIAHDELGKARYYDDAAKIGRAWCRDQRKISHTGE